MSVDESNAERESSGAFADFEIVETEDGRETPTDLPSSTDAPTATDSAAQVTEKSNSTASGADDSQAAGPAKPAPPTYKSVFATSDPKSTEPSNLFKTLRALAHYENPVRSGVVLAKLLGLYVLLVCDLGVTLLFIGAQVVLFSTTGALMLAVVKFVIDRHYNKIAEPKLFPQQLLEPALAAASDVLDPLFVSEESAVRAVRSLYASLPVVRTEILNVLYCVSFKRTAKVLVLSYLSGLVAWWFSIGSLALLAILGFFTVPMGYRTYKADVDHALDVANGHIQNACASLPPWAQNVLTQAQDLFSEAPQKAKGE